MYEEMTKQKTTIRVKTTLKPKNVVYCWPNMHNCRRQIWMGKGGGRGKQHHIIPSNYPPPPYRKLTLQLPLARWDWGFESPRGHGGLSLVSVECRQVQVSASSWALVQRSPTECGVSNECDRQEWTKSWPWPTRGCWAMKINIYIYMYIYIYNICTFIYIYVERSRSKASYAHNLK